MSFEAFTRGEEDPGRRKRLLVGYAVAAVLLTATLAAAALFAHQKVVRDQELEVKLVSRMPSEPPKAPEKPPPPPPPPPQVRRTAAAPGPKGKTVSGPPKHVPLEDPTKGDPSRAVKGDNPGDPNGGDPNGVIGGTGKGPALPPAPPAPLPPPAPPPPPPPPQHVVENTEPPVKVSGAVPAFPEEARARGDEAVVKVKFTVTETGEVRNVHVIHGHPSFDAAVIAAVRAWRYRPAVYMGRPVAYVKRVEIPFKIKS